MRSTDFPPDMSRGLDLPAVAITYQATTAGSKPQKLYTDSLLLVMPIPDNSMPYNVITYVSTLVVLFCGSLVNVIALRPPKGEKPKTPIQRLKIGLQKFFSKG